MTRRRRTLFCLLIVALCLAGACLDPENVYVDVGAAGPGLGTPDAPFPEIATGLFWAAPGGTVHVAGGEYPENLLISRPVKLVGAGPGNTRLLADITRKGIEVASDDVEIRGFSIAGVGEPDPSSTSVGGIWVEHVSRVTVAETDVGPYSYIGIGAGDGADFTIENNQVHDIAGHAEQENVGIIVVVSSSSAIRGNTVSNVDGSGFDIAEAGITVENNLVTGCPVGAYVTRSNIAGAEVSFVGNTIQGSSYGALSIFGSTFAQFSDNTIVGNPGFGLEISGWDTSIASCGNNTIHGNHPDFGDYLIYFGYLETILACLE